MSTDKVPGGGTVLVGVCR